MLMMLCLCKENEMRLEGDDDLLRIRRGWPGLR